MSQATRNFLALWGLLFLGFLILGIQIYRYATNQLGDFMIETPVFTIAVLFILYPKRIISLINSKYGAKND